MKKLKVFEAFAGIGSQTQALKNLGIEHEVVAIAEIDKYAIASYKALHGETNNLGDISQIDTEDIPDHNLFTYSFPCQDISVAGKQGGLDEGSGTRSGLLWECQKVIAVKKPKYLLLENVKNLVGKKHKPNFDKWLEWLEHQGYSNYWQVLNAKDYGIPQNRERIFVVSIFGEHEHFEFPEKQELKLMLKDMLDVEVDEKFYISEEKVNQLLANVGGNIDINKQVVGTCHPRNDLSFATRDRVYSQERIAPTLTATIYKDAPKIVQAGNYSTSDSFGDRQPKIIAENIKMPVVKRANDVDTKELVDLLRSAKKSAGLSNKQIADALNLQLSKVEHRFRTDSSFSVPDPNIWVALKTLLKINDGKFDSQITEFETVEGVYDQSNRVYDPNGIAATLTTTLTPIVKIKNATKQGYLDAVDGDGIDLAYPDSNTRRGRVQKQSSHTLQTAGSIGTLDGHRIRKLTPKECWRLMGFTDSQFYKASAVNSNTQLYKQAGNSIVVDVLEAIFAKLFKEKSHE